MDPVPARSVRSYYLHLAIPGWQGRVEEHFPMELRDALTHDTIVALEPALVIAAMTHLVGHARITAAVIGSLAPPALPEPAQLPLVSAPAKASPQALGVPIRPIQEARRAARRANSAHRKRVN